MKTKQKTQTLSRKLAWQYFGRMLVACILLIVSGIAFVVFALLFFNFTIWQGDELFYRFANWVADRLIFFGPLYYGVGLFFILRHYWFTPFNYFQELIDATETVNRLDDDTLVELSPPLAELEGRLNQIKVAALSNQRAARDAEQKKNDLVTYLAHDLKTPITSVIGYLTLMRDEPQISEEMRQRYMNITLDKAERLDDLINEFFEITRFNLSHIALEKRRINLSLMLQQLIYEFQPMLREKNLTCVLDVPDLITVRCDPDKLQRVFDNLLRNAVNYSFEDSEISIRAKAGDMAAALTFKNHGDTISRENLDRLFERFYRLDTSRSSKSGGAGLGLAIAKEIVELHGGTIRAASENDVIRFDVTLPL